MANEEYITVEEAADILQVTTRQVHRYGNGPNARVRTRRLGKRVMFYRGDIEALANDLGVVRSAVERTPKPPKTELIPINEMMLYLRERDQQLNEVQQQLNQALLRIGHLQGQLEQRLLPEDEQSLRPEDLPRCAQATEAATQAAQASLELEPVAGRAPGVGYSNYDNVYTVITHTVQAQLSHLQTQIWRRPPTDPKKCRTYYALQRKAAQVERSNPKQAGVWQRFVIQIAILHNE